LVGACLPILSVQLPPLGDYANHLARMHIIAHVGSDPFLGQYFTITWGILPNLAFDVLAAVRSPTLLIVGSHDVDVLELNAWAASHIQTSHAIKIVAGAGHLFEEPGCLEDAARLAREWFQTHLKGGPERS
jgi:pimeloyl-ACP methyl ester carboxylesterase